VLQVVSNSWALFLGLGLIMLGNGLQGSLLGLRASIEGFGVASTGLLMSGYYIGLLIGATMVPKFVARVGHVRSFGAMASLASTSILVHVVFVDPWIWWLMRFVTGFAYAGVFIVAESWLNDASENETRGRMLSFYMLVTLGGMAGGQFMLNIANPSSYELFVLISVLISIAVIPILLSVSKAPDFNTAESVSVIQLYRVSPLGVVGMAITGVMLGALFGLGAVYAANVGMSVLEVSFFMGAMVLGGAARQYPLDSHLKCNSKVFEESLGGRSIAEAFSGC
jgi:MFS family permease